MGPNISTEMVESYASCENAALHDTLFPMKMQLSHILVKERYEAEDLQRKLKEGAAFNELARKYSTCPSAERGGSLGNIELKRLVAEFADAAEQLKVGEVSGIVRTQFGHHLIRHDEPTDL